MPNTVKIKKLDGRMNGYRFWTHRTEPSMLTKRDALMNFVMFREFLTKTFGPGVHEREAGAVKRCKGEVPVWGYDDYCSIYCRDMAATLVITSAERFIKEY
jgi:hypothetical protein